MGAISFVYDLKFSRLNKTDGYVNRIPLPYDFKFFKLKKKMVCQSRQISLEINVPVVTGSVENKLYICMEFDLV